MAARFASLTAFMDLSACFFCKTAWVFTFWEETGEESPVEYAGNRIERAEQRVGKESTSAAYRGGKKLAVKTYEKLKAQKQKQRETATSPLEGETGVGGTSTQAGHKWQRKGERKPQEALNSNRKPRKRSRKLEIGR